MTLTFYQCFWYIKQETIALTIVRHRWTYADPAWARIAALVPVVVSSAEDGDGVANKILEDSVEEMADSVKAVIKRLGLGGKGKVTLTYVCSVTSYIIYH